MKREPGLDLLRGFGLFLVVSFHFFLYNYFYYVPQKGIFLYFADVFLTLTISCNGIFMMLTGYLKCEKKPCAAYYASLLPLLFSYVLASAANCLFRTWYLHEAISLSDFVQRLFSFSGAKYGWYVEMYLGLHFFAPVLNLAMEQISTKKQTLWLLATMALLTGLPADFPFLPGWWKTLYPAAYYCMGAAVKKWRPTPKSSFCLLGAGITAAFLGGVSYFAAAGGVYNDGYAPVFGSFGIMVQTALLFLSFYRAQPDMAIRRLARWVAAVSFEAYLLSYLFDASIYHLMPSLLKPARYPAAFLAGAVPVFLLSCLAGAALVWMKNALFHRKTCQISTTSSI